MRVVLDTNILVSALMVQSSYPGAIYRAWQEGGCTLLTCAGQLEEIKATFRKPAISERIKPHFAGRLINQLKGLAEYVPTLPSVRRSSDPDDDFLLALAEAGRANYLVTGDKTGLLRLRRHRTTRIVSAKDFAGLFSGKSRR
ncbi:MAG: putative toxin-antitoxin system toxin component, PIN family [Bryobacteraceae bacterium]